MSIGLCGGGMFDDNWLSGYNQGKTDKYQEIVLNYMLLTKEQISDIRKDAIDEFINAIATETEWRTESTAWNDVVRIAEQLKEQKNE